jgi:hypothetical protein
MMPENRAMSEDDDWQPEPQWDWRKCRDIGFEFHFWPLSWNWPWVRRQSDAYALTRELHVGPFVFGVNFNVGGHA